MELRFGTLADYAAQGAGNKPIVVGIFDSVLAPAQGPVPVPPCYLFAILEAHATEGTAHQIAIRLQDADGNDVMPAGGMQAPVSFAARGPGRTLAAFLAAYIAGLVLPGVGAYEFHILIDGRHVGGIPLFAQVGTANSS